MTSTSGFYEGQRAPYASEARNRRASHRWPELFRKTTIEEFEAFLDRADDTDRFEWVRGWIVRQQAEQTRRHARLEQRIEQLLLSQLDPARWQVLRQYAVVSGQNYRITDVVVDPADADDLERRSDHPALIVEVLSETSGGRDRVEKPAEFATIQTLAAYIVVDQFSRHCFLWLRSNDGTFPGDPVVVGDGERIAVDQLGVALAVNDIYEGILAPPQDT